MTKFLIALICCLAYLFSANTLGANITAVSSGNWTTNGTWSCNCQPTSSDNVTIPSGLTVAATGPVILFLGPVITITINGTLALNSGASLQVDSSDIIKINSGGKITSTGGLASVWSGVIPFFIPNGSTVNGPKTYNNGTLPVTCLFFKGEGNDRNVVLTWASAIETNFDFYLIERSTYGKTFTAIGNVKGTGNTLARRDYSFEDPEPPLGTVYYRLKTVDLDGTTSTISVIAVSFEPSFKRIDVFPNPMAGNDLHVKLNFHPEEGSRITLYDNAGALVFQKTLKTEDQINVLSLPETLSKGLYHMTVVTKTLSFRSKIIIQ